MTPFINSLNNLHDTPDVKIADLCSMATSDRSIRNALINANCDLNEGSENLKNLEKILGPDLWKIPFLKEHLTLEYNGLIRTGSDYSNPILDCSFFKFSYMDLCEILAELLELIEGVPFFLFEGIIITPAKDLLVTFMGNLRESYVYLMPEIQNRKLPKEYIYIGRDETFCPIKYLVKDFCFKSDLEPYKIDWKMQFNSFPYLEDFLKKLIYENYLKITKDCMATLTKEEALQIALIFGSEYRQQKHSLERKKVNFKSK